MIMVRHYTLSKQGHLSEESRYYLRAHTRLLVAVADKAVLLRENAGAGAKALPTARHVKGITSLD